MTKKNLVGLLFTTVTIGLAPVTAARAESAFFHAVTNLNPTAYWPMHETASAAPGNVEINHGTLGAVGNAYFGDWVANNAVARQVPGALTGDPDTAMAFSGNRPCYLLVPHTSSATTLVPPFTIECWANGTNTAFGDIIGQAGATRNGAGNDGQKNGVRLLWQGNNPAGPAFQVIVGDGSGTANFTTTTPYTPGQWYYLVLTCDANTNFTLYVDGSVAASASLPMAPTSWNPLTIGGSWWDTKGFPNRLVKGYVDEVAIYTNVLSDTDITAHHTAGTNGVAGSYYMAIINSAPLLYYRMDAASYTQPDVSTWPTMADYGSASVTGVYRPGMAPGSVAGPDNRFGALAPGFGADSNAAPCNGLSTFATATAADPSVFNVAYNAANDTPFTVAAWFKGNPMDSRDQMLVSHGNNSWYLRVTTYGYVRFGSGGGTPDGVNAPVNDGNWHYIVGTHSGNPNTNILYIDGVRRDGAGGANYTNGPGTTYGVYIGAAPDYTNNPVGPGRQLAGNLCEVAFWNGTALSASQIQGLYDVAGIGPAIVSQPATDRTVSGGDSTYLYFGVVASGSTVNYQWYFNSSSNYNGATRLVDGSKYMGSTTSQVTLTNLVDTDSGYYYVVITNNYGAVTSRLASVTVNMLPVVLTQYPVTYTNLFTLFAGSPTFRIGSASGTAPIAYQWYINGAKVPNATNMSYQVVNVPVGTLGAFCVLSNEAGMGTSYVWTASVVAPPTAPYPQSVLGLKPVGYWRLGEPDNGSGNGGVVALDYVGGNDGTYTNTSLGQPGYNNNRTDSETSALFGSLASSNSYAGQIMGMDLNATNGATTNLTVSCWVMGASVPTVTGTTILRKGVFGDNDVWGLDFDSNSAHRYRFSVRTGDGTVITVNTTVAGDAGAWHHLVGVLDEANGVVNLYIDGKLAGSKAVGTTAGLASAVNFPMTIGSSQNNTRTGPYTLQYTGYVNEVAVYNYALSAGQVLTNYLAAGIPPWIVQQPPASATVNEGGTLTLSAAALGTTPMSYQWLDNYASPLFSSQTSSTLLLNNVPASLNSDGIYMRAFNAYNEAFTIQVALTVISGPPTLVVSNLPAQVKLPLGKSYTYCVGASGTMPFSYQWYKNGTPQTGETGSSYTVTGTALGSSTISVVVQNGQGSASGSSVLTVINSPNDMYATNVLALNPVGYWPLQETDRPAAVTVETNYGTLGALGNAYYADTNGSTVTYAQGGALSGSGDNDWAVSFDKSKANSYAFVPRVSPALALRPPLSLECWMSPTASGGTMDLIGEGGSGLNSSSGAGAYGGLRMSFGGASGDGNTLQFFAYTGNDGKYNNSSTNIQTAAGSITMYAWNHCVATYDGTNVLLYVNGQLLTNGATPMAIDTWTPLTIGTGRWQGRPTRSYSGGEDEVAVYTNVLSPDRVLAHYTAGTTVSSPNYVQTVQTDKPLLYYRMNAPAFVAPNPGQYPQAVNYGSAPVNGSYAGGVIPGGMAGPSIQGLSTSVAAPINGIISGIDAGNDPAFNPSGSQPFSGLVWFKSYPADGRVQGLMSQGTNWAISLNGTNGTVVCSLDNVGSLSSTNTVNDGNWHMVAGVYDGANGYLYVDGALQVSAAVTGGLAGEPGANLMLGGNADFAVVGSGQQYLAGAIAQAAYFTNALSAAQIQNLYSVAVPTPTISIGYSGGNVVITYTGTLLSSPTVDGTYAPVAGASSPYVVPQGEAQRFYRARIP